MRTSGYTVVQGAGMANDRGYGVSRVCAIPMLFVRKIDYAYEAGVIWLLV